MRTVQVQYRMHPCLSEFPSNTFYEGALQNGVTEVERTNRAVAFPWPDASRCLMFYQQRGARLRHQGPHVAPFKPPESCKHV